MTFRASFHFDVKPEWEKDIREGRKTIDVRINVQPYADVNKGDIIKYRSAKVKVKKIRAYPGLSYLLAHEDYSHLCTSLLKHRSL